jgi:hypothetical protein
MIMDAGQSVACAVVAWLASLIVPVLRMTICFIGTP